MVLLKSCNTRSTQQPEKNTRRKRNLTWFNPPFSSNVKTKTGKKFFNILDKYFPKHHHLHKVINKNTVKLSYCCMPNIGRLLKAHNHKVLKQNHGDSTDQDSATCNCRNKTNCPFSGKCQIKSTVYQANVLSEDGASYSYIGLSKSVGQIIVKALRTRFTKLQQSYQNSYRDGVRTLGRKTLGRKTLGS